MNNYFDLHGKIALVLGGAGNLGEAICEGLAAHGANISIADLDLAKCEAISTRLSNRYSGKYISAQGDCSSPHDVQNILKKTDMLGQLDIIVHCIGLISSVPIPGYAVPFKDQTLETWNLAIEANLTSAFVLAQQLHLDGNIDKNKGSSVIFLSSIYGCLGPDWSIYKNTDMGNPLAYGASKGGLIQLMRYLATLWAPNARVNCVSPGGIMRDQPVEFINCYEKKTPLKRMAEVDDIVGPVIFFASEASKYITGQNLMVDGGWSVW